MGRSLNLNCWEKMRGYRLVPTMWDHIENAFSVHPFGCLYMWRGLFRIFLFVTYSPREVGNGSLISYQIYFTQIKLLNVK